MSIYMRINGVPGSVTDVNHKNWISVRSFESGVSRAVQHRVGFGEPRDSSIPKFSVLKLSKKADASSGELYQRACSGKVFPSVRFHVCNEANSQSPYVEYVLSDVLITRFVDSVSSAGMPSEQISLSYLKMERSYINKTASGALSAPKRVGYDLMKAVVS